MAVNERFYDDSNFLPIGSAMPPPATVGVLLFSLKLSNADLDEQTAGIKAWLAENIPTPGLVRSLRRRGFSDLVPE